MSHSSAFSPFNKKCYSALIVLIFCVINLNAQSNEIKISFDEYITSSSLPGSGLDEASWKIFNDKDNIISSGNADELYKFKFEQPGLYTIRFVHEHKHNGHAATCNHYAMPAEVKVNVNSKKIIFDTDKISFSEKISSNGEIDNLIMYVPVILKGDNSNELIEINKAIISYGVNCSLNGELIPEQHKLKAGTHVLKFKLKGKVSSGTYIGFDLIDLNGNVIPFGLTEPIQ